jgi:hypothetical protein
MENKKIAAILLLIAITLSAFGIVYAHWSDTATIHGVIQMGTLDIAFYTGEDPVADEFFWNATSHKWQSGEVGGKNVGSANAKYEDLITDTHSGKDGYKTLVINITNAYPGYAVHTTWRPHNIGTVPLYIYGITLVGNKTESNGSFVYHLLMNTTIDSAHGYILGTIWEDVNDNNHIDPAVDKRIMELSIKDSTFPLQLDPCHDDKGEFDLVFDEDAEMCHKYTLRFSLLAVQWDKLSEVYP